jgi:hypothetical protein
MKTSKIDLDNHVVPSSGTAIMTTSTTSPTGNGAPNGIARPLRRRKKKQ